MGKKYYSYSFDVYRRDGTRVFLDIPADTVRDAVDELEKRIPDAVNIRHIGRKP